MPTYKSDAFEAIYEDALANFEIGVITREELEEYERACFISEDTAGAGPRQTAGGCLLNCTFVRKTDTIQN